MRQCGRLQLDGTPAAALQDFAAIAPRLAVCLLLFAILEPFGGKSGLPMPWNQGPALSISNTDRDARWQRPRQRR